MVPSHSYSLYYLIVQPVPEGEPFLIKIAYTYSMRHFGPSRHNAAFHGRILS